MKKMLLASTIVLVMTGCASVVNEKTQVVNVQSSDGRPVKGTVNGQPFSGPGPVYLTRENRDKLFVTETAGCAHNTVAPKQMDSIFWGNVLIGGFFGSTTDSATEKMWKYQESVTIPCGAAAPQK